MNIKRIGLDQVKIFFQMHAVDHGKHVVLRKTLRRDRMAAFFTQLIVLKSAALPATGPVS